MRITYLFFFLVLTSCSQSKKSQESKPVIQEKEKSKISKAKTSSESKSVQLTLIEESTGIAFLKKFYIKYITLCDGPPANNESLFKLRNDNCSERLIKRLSSKQLHYDPLTQAQDCSRNWLNSLVIKKGNGENTFLVRYKDSYNKELTTVRLKLIIEYGQILIDEVID